VDVPEICDLLRTVQMFRGLPEDALGRLARACELVRVKKGTILFRQGELGDTMLVVVDGFLSVAHERSAEERIVLRVLTEGDALGELALIDGERRSATVVADSDAVLLQLGRDVLDALLIDEPALTRSLLVAVTALLRELTLQTGDLVFLDLAGRTAKTLLTLAEDQVAAGGVPRVEVTQSRLAEMVGGTRQSVNQALAAFAQRDLVQLEGRAVHLVDVEGLRRRARL
jgi:CRP/FNR family cyclic AMP-dependent transcriptional regulator